MGEELIKYNFDDIMELFSEEKDRTGTDLFAMSNFFDKLILCANKEIKGKTELVSEDTKKGIDYESITSEIVSAIKYGYHLSNAGTLVADASHLDQYIIEGLKKGIYHLGISKEVPGHFRPVILDDKERIIKWLTLKWTLNPIAILSDLTTMSMQAMLCRISENLDEVKKSLKRIEKRSREKDLQRNFLFARDRICELSSENEYERKIQLLDEADKYLMEGIASVYQDIDNSIKDLSIIEAKAQNLNSIEELLQDICEDMCLLPRYIGFRVFLLYKCKKYDTVKLLLERYESFFRNLTEVKVNDKYTRTELMHEYYKYNKKNRDFWIEMPIDTIKSISDLRGFIEDKQNNVVMVIEGDNN